ncbi:MAG TPA: PEP-CTERM sorting domain-containing protein [Nitrosospira sp.]|jgi:hypothetical protein|nr:PEP-CTERM sorting domain-containing protein [Nitrosospira sp.]
MNPKQIKHLTIGTLSAALAMPLVAQAELFTFDPTGSGAGTANVALIDQAPGSALAQGGVTAINNFLAGSGSTSFTLHYQANLSSMQFEDTSIAFANGSGGNFFTFVAGFGERVVGAQPYPGTATFAFDASNPVNFFNMYASNAIGNNLTGAGFMNGTPILTAHIVAIPTSNFQVTDTTPTTLDHSPNGDQWGGQQTVTGGGVSDITLVIDSVNSAYFPSLHPADAVTISFFNSSQVDPFRQVDPSQCVNTEGSDCGAGGGINVLGTLGAVNGTSGPNFIMQADGNQAFTVAEPASLALMGLGLSFMGFFGRSRRRAG